MKKDNPLSIPPNVGEIRADSSGTVRVMAVVEGHVVARRKGCMPFLETVNNFNQRFKPVEKVELAPFILSKH